MQAALSLHTARQDFIAGCSTAAVLIPQAVAYSVLAGVPPQVGLYAALVAPIVYALLGTSAVLIVAPAALDSLLVATAVSGIAAVGSSSYLSLVLLLGLMVGVIQLILGLSGGGFLVNFLSRPVLSGFTSAAAVVIAAQQIPHLLGTGKADPVSLWQTMHNLAVIDNIQPISLGLGLTAIVAMLVGKRRWPQAPWVIIVLAISIVLTVGLKWTEQGLAVVGAIPAGFPRFVMPELDWSMMRLLLPSAITLALVSLTEGVSAANACRVEQRPTIKPNREFAAVGAANVASACFGGLAVAGGLSRTAVNWRAGARSKLASLVAAALVALTLLWFTTIFANAPKTVLAAVIIVSVASLIDIREIRRLYKVKQSDMWLALLTAGVTLAWGILEGILAGIGASLLLMIIHTTVPHTAVLGRLPGSSDFRNIRNYPQAQTFPGLLILRMDAQFYFGNVAFLQETLRRLEAEQTTALQAVVLDASGMNQIDSTAAAALAEIASDYRERGIQLLLANVKVPVRNVLAASGFIDQLGPENFYLNNHAAVEAALKVMQAKSTTNKN